MIKNIFSGRLNCYYSSIGYNEGFALKNKLKSASLRAGIAINFKNRILQLSTGRNKKLI